MALPSHGSLISHGLTARRSRRTLVVRKSSLENWPNFARLVALYDIVGDTAIVRHTFTGETEHDGKTNPVTIGVLRVWHQQNGDWTLLTRQAVRLKEPRPKSKPSV